MPLKNLTDLGLSYEEAGHGVQTAIAFKMGQGEKATEPKHMRTGIDMSKADMLGLVELLIDKNIITSAEYLEAIRLSANQELALHEEEVQQKYNIKTSFR